MYSFSGPAEVRGRYQKLRNILQPLLIAIFLSMPWLKVNGGPVFLFDILQRHFIFFGYTFFSHDTPLFFFLVILLVLAIFTVTALFGRLWCGWSCPQTVFIQGLFNRIEKLILGSYTKRVSFFHSADSAGKRLKMLALYFIYLTLCWVLAHSLAAYFIGAERITQFIQDGPSNHLQLFSLLSLATLGLFFNFTFFREKLCFYVCPYGRFQNALIDRNSLGIFYDASRGEPRGKISSIEKSPKGSCIDCNRCVAVCPTKIDIRQGFQLECIACGKCIDACNEVMAKIKRPLGLIRFDTSDQKPLTMKKFRIGLYLALILIFSFAFIYSLESRRPVVISVTRAHPNPFSSRLDSEGQIVQNQVVIHLKNQTNQSQAVKVELSPEDLAQGFRLIGPTTSLVLEAGQDLKSVGFLEIPRSKLTQPSRRLMIRLSAGNAVEDLQIYFVRVD